MVQTVKQIQTILEGLTILSYLYNVVLCTLHPHIITVTGLLYPLVCIRNIFVSLRMQFGIWMSHQPFSFLSLWLHQCGNQTTYSYQVMTLTMHHQHTIQGMVPNLLKFHLLFFPLPLLRYTAKLDQCHLSWWVQPYQVLMTCTLEDPIIQKQVWSTQILDPAQCLHWHLCPHIRCIHRITRITRIFPGIFLGCNTQYVFMYCRLRLNPNPSYRVHHQLIPQDQTRHLS